MISPEAYDQITNLLVIDPLKRLGYNGAQEVKNHPFFKGIDWENIYEEEPPIEPDVDINHVKLTAKPEPGLNALSDKEPKGEKKESPGKDPTKKTAEKELNSTVINFERFDLQAESNKQVYSDYIHEKTNYETEIEKIRTQLQILVKEHQLF